ncbi:MAG: hypothetical protein K1X65_02840 [Caldilineales bacterium]|nr:hypothetical protein [Caldilineales bacterium]MCW5858403.1 hypothetical protein [Caldilineales bacterium]
MSRAHLRPRRLLWLSLVLALTLLVGVTVQAAGVPTDAVAQPAATNTIISLGQAANYAILGYNILLHNTDVWGGPVGVGYNNATGVGKMQVEAPGVVHDAPVYKDPSATITGNTGPGNLVQGIVTQEMDAVFADAMAAYNAALALTPDYTVNGSINSTTTIAATHGGQYVIKITGDIKSKLVLTPFPGQTTKFVVILEGTITLGGSDTVGAADAAGAKDVLIVVDGAGTTMTSQINNKVYGTMLAPYRGASFHGFNGSFIGGDLQAKFMSDCQIYLVGYESLDFGDAPTAAQSGFANSYPTTLAANGARHTAVGPNLGSARDAESDGQPSAAANGDDNDGTPDDEDGVTIPALKQGQTAALTVNASAAAKLDAWIDWNRDGDWNDAGEQVAANLAMSAGNNTLNVNVPAGASLGTSYARFRLSTAGGLAVTGAASDGEVEDYQVTIQPGGNPALTVVKEVSVDNQATWEDANLPTGPSTTAEDDVYFRFGVTNTGDVALSNVSLTDSVFALGSCPAIPNPFGVAAVYTCVLGPVPAISGQHSNTATASGSFNGIPVQDSDPAHYLGVAPPNSIGDYVWNDINGNGLQDDGANRGLNAVTVRLYVDDGDGVYEPGAGDALVGSQDTAGDGNYLFAGLTSGDYWVDVDENDLIGYTQIIGAESEPQPLFIELLPGEDFTVADFGFAGRGNISGVVFYDWDESGDQGLGEDGIPNVEVCLYRDADNDGLVDFGSSPISCQNTLADGSYIFTNQLPGDYLVVETPPSGLVNTTPYIRDVLLIVVGTGGSAPGNDFGHVNFGSIGDFIYLDSNGNGSQDLGENLGIAGVPVTVKNVSTLEETTVTSGPTGLYLVDGLAPGVYEVSTPASWPGLARTTVSPQTVNLGQGQNYVLADFGYIAPTSVQLASFTARAKAGGVLVRWATSYEREQAGFRVWRATAADGDYEAVSGVIEAANSEMGASYEWFDVGATAGGYWYKIESLPDGQMFGPVGAEAEQGLARIFTPLVFRRH